MLTTGNVWKFLATMAASVALAASAQATTPDSFFDIWVDLHDEFVFDMTSAATTYDGVQTEMLAMDLAGSASSGSPTVTDLGGGDFRVDSFFDIDYAAAPPGGSPTFDSFFDIVVSVEYTLTDSSADHAEWDTEILSMDLRSAQPDGGSQTRPALSSNSSHRHHGHVTILKLAGPGGGDQFQVDSFFDIFTELSTDGGGSYHAATNGPSTHEFHTVVPEPTTGALLALGLVGLALRRGARS